MKLSEKVNMVLEALRTGEIRAVDVATHVGMDAMTITHYKNGRSKPENMRLSVAEKIEEYYEEVYK